MGNWCLSWRTCGSLCWCPAWDLRAKYISMMLLYGCSLCAWWHSSNNNKLMSRNSTRFPFSVAFSALTRIIAVITTTSLFWRRNFSGISAQFDPEMSATEYLSPRKASKRSFCCNTRFTVLTINTTRGWSFPLVFLVDPGLNKLQIFVLSRAKENKTRKVDSTSQIIRT